MAQPMTDRERWDLALSMRNAILAACHRYHVAHDDREDVLHGVLLKLHRRVPEWDPNVAKWVTFSMWIIRGEVQNLKRSTILFGTRTHPEQRVGAHLVDSLCDGGIHATETAMDAKPFLSRLQSQCSPRDQNVVRMRMHGATLKEIGAEIGVTGEGARLVLRRALRRIGGKHC